MSAKKTCIFNKCFQRRKSYANRRIRKGFVEEVETIDGPKVVNIAAGATTCTNNKRLKSKRLE